MSEPWPDLTLSNWQDTRDTLHMWTQVVGKVRLALEPMINHWWQVTLYVSARGLTTSIMPAGDRGLEIEFDFVDHVLDLRATDGARRQVPRTVRTGSRDWPTATRYRVAATGPVAAARARSTPTPIRSRWGSRAGR